jgi:hypothetical protein
MSNDTDSDIKLHNRKVLNCAICLEEIESDVQFLPCIHPFHGECINEWIREQPVCPICKVPVYVNTTEQLDRYNHHKSHQDRIAEEEAMFFQRVSAGAYDNEPERVILRTFPIENSIREPNTSLVDILSQLLPDHQQNGYGNNNSYPTTTQIQALGAVVSLFDYTIGRPDDHKENNQHNDTDAVNIDNSMNENYNNILDSNNIGLIDPTSVDVNQISHQNIPNTSLNQINTEIRSNVNNEPEFSADSGRRDAMQYLMELLISSNSVDNYILNQVVFPLPSSQLLSNMSEEPVSENIPNQSPTDESDDDLNLSQNASESE